MSILIKGMDMPKNCENCPIREGTFCDIISKDIDRFYDGAVRRDKDCPLVEEHKQEALELLLDWAIECDFGYDNLGETYDKYADEVAEMGYKEGLIYIATREVEE